MKTKMARLDIAVYVDCPHCNNFIDLMNPEDTSGEELNEDGAIVSQACPNGYWIDEHKKFSIEGVKCSDCGNRFNVKELEW